MEYEVPPVSDNEKQFLLDTNVDQELSQLYLGVRHEILQFGKIEVAITKNYINFRHPYKRWNRITRQKEDALGTLVNVHFNKNSLTLAFNTCGATPSPCGLRPTSSYGVCEYYMNITPDSNLAEIREALRRCIYYVSKECRAVKIDGKIIITGKD